jgi:uncharacterized protein YecE (DUF72 family)
MSRRILVGTAGWSIPKGSAEEFEGEGTHLQRYARRLACVEINSSFYRPHEAAVYERWAAAAPEHFRFSVKLPRLITHEQKLRRARVPLERFLEETAGLGEKRGPILVQLPPSLAYETSVARRFFDIVRAHDHGLVVCEPRHESWFSAEADTLLVKHKVARAAVDPAPAPGADRPGGWRGFSYYRLHGSPKMYASRYDAEWLAALADGLQRIRPMGDAWVIFDNTAAGAATENATELQALLTGPIPDAAQAAADEPAVPKTVPRRRGFSAVRRARA